MVAATTAGYRVLLGDTQTWQRLAGVEQPHTGALEQVDVVAGARGGGRQRL